MNRTLLRCFGLTRTKCISRQFHASKCLRIDPKNVEEVRIPVPWGHIAGVWYGDKTIQPVIALHGLQDNAATWEPLAPLLNIQSLLCLDMPGHGQSSHLAPGLTLHYLDNVLFLRYLLERHFKFSSDLILLGHSFGASLWFMYSTLYPAQVSKFISIETAMYNMMRTPEKVVQDLRKSLDSFIDIETKVRDPQSFDQLLKQMHDSRQRNFPVSMERCKILLKRGTTPVGDKVIFSGDPRLNIRFLGNLTPDFLLELSSRLKCKYLNIRAEDGIPTGDALRICEETLNIIKKSNKHVLDIFVPGGHHVHLEDPETIASVVNKFLNNC